MKQIKYVVMYWQNTKLQNTFEFTKEQKPEAIALVKNLALRYGERNVEAHHIYYDESEPYGVNVTEQFLMA